MKKRNLTEEETIDRQYRILYKCNKSAFEKKVSLLKEAIAILDNNDWEDFQKAYAILNFFSNIGMFEKKFNLLLLNGKDEPLLADCYNRINDVANALKSYEEKGYKELARIIRTNLEPKIPAYEIAKPIIFDYIRSTYIYDEDFLKEEGITKEEFKYHVSIVERVAPNLYQTYFNKKNENIKARYYDTIARFIDIANALETGNFLDGKPITLSEVIARMPFKQANQAEYDAYRKINPQIEEPARNLVSRVSNFIRVTLNSDQYRTIMGFL